MVVSTDIISLVSALECIAAQTAVRYNSLPSSILDIKGPVIRRQLVSGRLAARTILHFGPRP
jgi:hypothetical protein